MTPPIRPAVHILVDLPEDPGTMTLRAAVEWWKNCIKGMKPLGMLTALEEKYMNQRWAGLVSAIAEVQKVPAGMLSYFLGELAQTELSLAETAATELNAAVSYE